MKTEPTKLDGKIREQIEKENAVRRQYPNKWGKLIEPGINAFYNQNFINEKIRKSGFKDTNICPYKYTGHGDSYFVSKDMYESLLSTCRCGRTKSEGHIIKCLQKVKNKYLNTADTISIINSCSCDTCNNDGSSNSSSNSTSVSSRSQKEQSVNNSNNITMTTIMNNRKNSTNSKENIIGLPTNRQLMMEWERATHYISPKCTMPGYKIDDHPYSAIFIG